MPSAIGIDIFPPFMQPIAAHLTCFLYDSLLDVRTEDLGCPIHVDAIEIDNEISKTQPQNDIMTWHIKEALRKKESREFMSQLITTNSQPYICYNHGRVGGCHPRCGARLILCRQ